MTRASEFVQNWLDDDSELRIPDNDFGRDLHAALNEVIRERQDAEDALGDYQVDQITPEARKWGTRW